MINTVKKQENGYLVNGNTYVPNYPSNRYYRDIQEWITDGGIVEPEFTDNELAKIKQDEINAEARMYLKNTDWYIIRNQETGEVIPTEVVVKRQEARASIVDKELKWA